MEKYLARALWAGLCVTMLQAETQASTQRGKVEMVRANAGSGASVRVGIRMTGDTDCPYNGWYAFEGADAGLGKVWNDLVLESVQAGKELDITGSGICDEWSVEGISNIDLIR